MCRLEDGQKLYAAIASDIDVLLFAIHGGLSFQAHRPNYATAMTSFPGLAKNQPRPDISNRCIVSQSRKTDMANDNAITVNPLKSWLSTEQDM